MKSARRPTLTRERIVRAAVRLADRSGIESLTMRKLARTLRVEAMSLYNHVTGKADLVDAMVDAVVGEIELPTGEAAWDAAVRRCALSAHEVLLRHPWACSLVISGGSTDALPAARLRYMEWLLGRLREAGFPPKLAYSGYHALDSHILGFTQWQLGHAAATRGPRGDRSLADLAEAFLGALSADDYPFLIEHVHQHLAAPTGDGRREFEFGLNLILEGLERARRPTGPQ